MENSSMIMLQAVDAVLNSIKKSKLDNSVIKRIKEPLKVISDKLGTNEVQSMLMAIFINHTFDFETTINDLFNGTKCTTSRKIELMNDIDYLANNHYVIRHRNDDRVMCFKIPNDVLSAFQHNASFIHKGPQKGNIRELFLSMCDLFQARGEEEFSYSQLTTEISNLFDVNQHLDFVKKIRSYNYSEDTKMLLLLFCHRLVNRDDDDVRWSNIEFLYEEGPMRRIAHSSILDEDFILRKDKIIENSSDDGYKNAEGFKLTDKTKRYLLSELHLKSQGNNVSNVIKNKDIKVKKMFYTHSVESQVSELKSLLRESQYKKICQRMKKKGFHSGFACLFYGTPGTGKTETAYQLAKATGRDIMMVDIPQIRSMWVGESEKNVKGIFERYANLVQESKRAPILLFNEADAIIGKRTQHHDSAADKSENTMQNIILQEMENLNGILIATTNLQNNMDTAFERRFLYKIQFDRPDAKTKAKIWHSMLPELDDNITNILAGNYDFSGGQIENIARHYTIETILKGEETVTLQTLKNFCDQESIKKEVRPIGFHD